MNNFFKKIICGNNFILCFLIAFLLLAIVAFFFDRAAAFGLMLPIALALATSIIIMKFKPEDKGGYYVFWIVFIIHILVALFIYFTDFRPFGGGADYELYHNTASELAYRLRHGDFSLSGLYLAHYFPILIGIIYTLTFSSMIAGQLFIAWFSGLSAIATYFLTLEAGGSKKTSFLAGLFLAFYPSYAYFGSLLLKDTLVVPLVIIGLLLSLKIIKEFTILKFSVFFIVLTAVIHFRFYIGYALLLGFLFSWFFISSFNVQKKIKYGLTIFLILGFSPMLAGNGYYGINLFLSFLSPEKITYYREEIYNTQPVSNSDELSPLGSNSVGGQGSSFVVDTGFKNGIFSFLINYIKSFLFSLFGPFPWQFLYKRQASALIETIPWYTLLGFFIYMCYKLIRRSGINIFLQKNRIFLPLVLFCLFALGALSLFINNYGIIFRIRMPVFICFFIIFCVIFESFLENTQKRVKYDKFYKFL